jgi:WXG100 family type VII secretion target
MAQNTFDFDAMRRAIGVVEGTVGNLNRINGNMSEHAAELARSYTGVAANKYHTVMAEWGTIFSDIVVQLGTIEDSLKRNLRSNVTNEDENSPLVSSIQAALQS